MKPRRNLDREPLAAAAGASTSAIPIGQWVKLARPGALGRFAPRGRWVKPAYFFFREEKTSPLSRATAPFATIPADDRPLNKKQLLDSQLGFRQMSDDTAIPDGDDESSNDDIHAINLDSLKALHTAAQSVVADIRAEAELIAAKSRDIEQGRLHASSVQAEIDNRLAAMDELIKNIKEEHAAAAKTSRLRKRAVTAFEEIQSIQKLLADSINAVDGIKANAEQSQEVIATKSQHIEGARTHADEVRAALDDVLVAARQSASQAESERQAIHATRDELTAIYTALQGTKVSADNQAAAVAELHEESVEYAATSKGLADIAIETEQRIQNYESRLVEFHTAAAELQKTIESLLPGAASAGLASAFNSRRSHFKWPQLWWQGVFLASVLGLLVIAGLEFSLFTRPDTPLTWDRLGLSLMHRLPFAVPLIWLAFHAAHKAALAQRVEEDYAFKETVSRSFEGFRREMAELVGKAEPESALARLCDGVLTIITNPPGRIYDKHQLNHSPLNALSENILPVAEAASKATKITFDFKVPE